MKRVHVLLFIALLLFLAGSERTGDCQDATGSSNWQVKKLAFEVVRLHVGLPLVPGSDIFVIDTPNSKPKLLVEGVEPAWSPDGERIAYCDWNGRTSAQMWVMNADGSGKRQLTHVTGLARLPLWSPDGERIAFTTFDLDKTPTVSIMGKNGENVTSLTEGSGEGWSPDGKRLVVCRGASGSRGRYGTRSIWIVNADGTGERKVAEGTQWHCGGTWLPDGSGLAFPAEYGHQAAIFRISLDGANIQMIAADEKKKLSLAAPIFSPDGKQVVVSARVRDPDHTPTVILLDVASHRGRRLATGRYPSVIWEKTTARQGPEDR